MILMSIILYLCDAHMSIVLYLHDTQMSIILYPHDTLLRRIAVKGYYERILVAFSYDTI
jgi:hypothetical protein